MKKINKILTIAVIWSAFLGLAGMAGATVELVDPLGLDKTNPIPVLANRLIQTALGFSGVLALMAFIYGGVLYLTAGIDPNNVKKAKDIMKWAVIGLMIIFLSSPIVLFILKTVLQVQSN